MAKIDGVEAIVHGLMNRIDEVVDGAVREIWETIPSYARYGDDLRSEVRAASRENVTTLAQILGQQREISGDELEAIQRVGARRAESGIPLDDVLNAYRMVVRLCWDTIADECRRFRGNALEATIQLAQSVLRYTDELASSAAEGYAQAQRAIVREQEGERRDFLSELLYGSEGSAEEVLGRAHTFGYDLSLDYVALVGIGPAGDAHAERAVVSAAKVVAPHSSADPIVLQKGKQTIALIPGESPADPLSMAEKLVTELAGDWRFGMGGPAPGLKGIRRAYVEAREALEIGAALELRGPIHRCDDLLLYHFLRVEPALLERFVDQMLGPLIAYDERRKGELIKTIEAYFSADGSVKMAGQMLFAHPHTVTYRLKQVEKLTGWSLRDPEDKLRLQLALRADRLARARRASSP